MESPQPVGPQAAIQDWREVKLEATRREAKREALFASVTSQMKEVNQEFSRQFASGFHPKFTDSLARLPQEIEHRAKEMTRAQELHLGDEFGSRLNALEKRTSMADSQLSDLRQTCLRAYQGIQAVISRLDGVWNQAAPPVAARHLPSASKTEARQPSTETEAPLKGPGRLCPNCGERKGRRKPKTSVTDDLLGLIKINPYRCKRCLHRYYRFSFGRHH